jgi:hypothetical protein
MIELYMASWYARGVSSTEGYPPGLFLTVGRAADAISSFLRTPFSAFVAKIPVYHVDMVYENV